MIARIGNDTFFGIPPTPFAPEAPTESDVGPPSTIINPETSVAFQPPPERQHVVADNMPLRFSSGNNDDDDDDDDVDGDKDTTVHSPSGNTSINADTCQRRDVRSSYRREESRNTDAFDALVWNQDEKAWQTWHEQELLGAFSRLIPERGIRSLVWKGPRSSNSN